VIGVEERVPSGTSLRFLKLIVLALSITMYTYGSASSGRLDVLGSASAACHVQADRYPTVTGVANPDESK
jgi:hypothetical protein